jgi:hypothetical protein
MTCTRVACNCIAVALQRAVRCIYSWLLCSNEHRARGRWEVRKGSVALQFVARNTALLREMAHMVCTPQLCNGYGITPPGGA